MALAPPVAPFGDTDIQRLQQTETRLLAPRDMRLIAGIAQQDRALLCGLMVDERWFSRALLLSSQPGLTR